VDVLGYFAPPQGGFVTSITAGTGLTGGTITSTGTIGLAPTQLLPAVSCATNQIPKWSGTAWACAADASSGGTVTGVTASAPLASSGGTAPNISLTGGVPVANGGTGQTTLAANGVLFGQGTAAVGTAVGAAGQVLTGTAGAPAWTGSPSLSGNLTLVNSTASAGNILKGATPFIHNFGAQNTFIGESSGNFLTTGVGNTAVGWFAMRNVAAGGSNTAIGNAAFSNSTAGGFNVLIGAGVGLGASMGDFNTIVGTNAFGATTSAFQNTGLGGGVLNSVTSGINNTALGYGAGSNITTGTSNISIGNAGGNESGVIRIGNFLQNKTFIAGIRGVTPANNDALPVVIDSSGQLGTTSPFADPRFGNNTSQALASNGRDCTLGEIILSAGVRGVGLPADGRLIPIGQNTALFALIGTIYGGNGTTNFALPDLRGVAPNGLTYTICDVGIFPSLR
jgi:hypothetical protein